MHPIYMGVDPGLKGAVCALIPDQPPSPLATMLGTPTYKAVFYDFKASVARMGIDSLHFSEWLKSALPQAFGHAIVPPAHFQQIKSIIMLENPLSRPTDGHVGAMSFGRTCGQIEAVLLTQSKARSMLNRVSPAVWKGSMGLSSDKKRSLSLAYRRAGELNIILLEEGKKFTHDRAEAFLLACWGMEKFSAPKS